MSIQVSTRIDESTKKQFDSICKRIGTSPSNALSMFIQSVINHNGIPFRAVIPETENLTISEKTTAYSTIRPSFDYGCMSGSIWMAEDFDEPLDDFQEYMQ